MPIFKCYSYSKVFTYYAAIYICTRCMTQCVVIMTMIIKKYPPV